MEPFQQQVDQFGVLPLGSITTSDLSDIAMRALTQEVYVGRLRNRIAELEAEVAALKAPQTGEAQDGQD